MCVGVVLIIQHGRRRWLAQALSHLSPSNGIAAGARLAVYDFKAPNSDDLWIPDDFYTGYLLDASAVPPSMCCWLTRSISGVAMGVAMGVATGVAMDVAMGVAMGVATQVSTGLSATHFELVGLD